MSEITGTFVVTEADAESAILRDVGTGQVHTLSENPDLASGEVVEATIAPEPPMDVTYTVVEEAARRTIEVVETDLEPTRQAHEMAEGVDTGELVTAERAGEGEVHVLTVPPEDVADAAADVVDDEETVARAARLGAVRVEVRTGEDFVNVRYLPD